MILNKDFWMNPKRKIKLKSDFFVCGRMEKKVQSVKFDIYKGRNRKNEVRKDNQILAAKVKYLESNKDSNKDSSKKSSKIVDDFLTLLRDTCPKPTFQI